MREIAARFYHVRSRSWTPILGASASAGWLAILLERKRALSQLFAKVFGKDSRIQLNPLALRGCGGRLLPVRLRRCTVSRGSRRDATLILSQVRDGSPKLHSLGTQFSIEAGAASALM